MVVEESGHEQLTLFEPVYQIEFKDLATPVCLSFSFSSLFGVQHLGWEFEPLTKVEDIYYLNQLSYVEDDSN